MGFSVGLQRKTVTPGETRAQLQSSESGETGLAAPGCSFPTQPRMQLPASRFLSNVTGRPPRMSPTLRCWGPSTDMSSHQVDTQGLASSASPTEAQLGWWGLSPRQTEPPPLSMTGCLLMTSHPSRASWW